MSTMIETAENIKLRTMNSGILVKMKDLWSNGRETNFMCSPRLTQYSIHLPFRVAVVGQTDSGKTHSITHRWLDG